MSSHCGNQEELGMVFQGSMKIEAEVNSLDAADELCGGKRIRRLKD